MKNIPQGTKESDVRDLFQQSATTETPTPPSVGVRVMGAIFFHFLVILAKFFIPRGISFLARGVGSMCGRARYRWSAFWGEWLLESEAEVSISDGEGGSTPDNDFFMHLRRRIVQLPMMMRMMTSASFLRKCFASHWELFGCLT